MKNDILRGIIINATIDILQQEMSIEDQYNAIQKLYSFKETELRILLEAIGNAKQTQIDQKRKDLFKNG